MTRLIESDIKDIPNELPVYDSELTARTGCSLFQIACRAAGGEEKKVRESLQNTHVGVIPITTGLGRLHGFCRAVAAIANHIGCQASVCRQTDVAGISEAIAADVDIIVMADEQQFIALNLKTRHIADNAVATGRGFVTALRLMAGSSLKKQRVLVLGCGPVGQNAVKTLLGYDCPVSVYDLDPLRSASLMAACGSDANSLIPLTSDIEDVLLSHTMIIDATPAGGFIRAKHIKAETMISAPGMPLGLDLGARAAIGKRLIHDPLQIGVATMLAMAVT